MPTVVVSDVGHGCPLDDVRAELGAAVLELETESRSGGADTAARADAVAAAARESGDTEIELRAVLVGADMLRRDGGAVEAHRLVQDVRRWASEHGSPHLRARCAYLLSAVWQNLGDLATALAHAIEAVELQDDDTPVALRLDHVARLADCLGLSGDDSAAGRYAEVLQLARDTGDVHREMLALNNWAYVEMLAGRLEVALGLADQLRAWSLQHGRELTSGSLDTIARVLMGLDRLVEAEAVMLPGLRAADALVASGDGDAGTDFLLTLAEVQRRADRAAQAQDTLDECVRRCDQHGLTGNRVRARREQAELHALRGDHRAAYAELGRFVDQLLAQQSADREARTRALQAVFETTEARQQSRRYRELSLRDALTGLYNRRWVDEQLPRLLAGGDGSVGTLTVALLDLDHFKRVNDTCSHDVGDQVLTTVAGILQSTTGSGGVDLGPSFAARMGGEEFLLVLVEEDADRALQRLEAVRRAVADHPWAPVTGTVPVTISIGATTVDVPSRIAPGDLLRRADGHLYQAKGRGRDRVVGDG